MNNLSPVYGHELYFFLQVQKSGDPVMGFP